jgi:hypothetical protein
MHLAEVILLAREDGFTHIQIGEGRLSLKSLPRAFSDGDEYLYRFAPEAHLCLLTPFGNQLYPLLSLQPLLRRGAQVEEKQSQGPKGAEVNRIVTGGSRATVEEEDPDYPPGPAWQAQRSFLPDDAADFECGHQRTLFDLGGGMALSQSNWADQPELF